MPCCHEEGQAIPGNWLVFAEAEAVPFSRLRVIRVDYRVLECSASKHRTSFARACALHAFCLDLWPGWSCVCGEERVHPAHARPDSGLEVRSSCTWFAGRLEALAYEECVLGRLLISVACSLMVPCCWCAFKGRGLCVITARQVACLFGEGVNFGMLAALRRASKHGLVPGPVCQAAAVLLSGLVVGFKLSA